MSAGLFPSNVRFLYDLPVEQLELPLAAFHRSIHRRMDSVLVPGGLPSAWIPLMATAIALVVVCLYSQLKRIRSQHPDAICLPRHSIFGHIVSAGKMIRRDRHPDYGFLAIWEKLGQPSVFYIDFRPLGRPLFVIADPNVAETITRASPQFKYSWPKGEGAVEQLDSVLGDRNMLTKAGEEWRRLRRTYSPGFQPKHINALIPLIVDHMKILMSQMFNAADNKESIQMIDVAKDFSVDVITHAALGRDLGIQRLKNGEGEKSRFGLITSMRNLVDCFPDGTMDKIYIKKKVLALFYSRIVDYHATRYLKRLFMDDPEKTGPKSTSFFSLATIDKPINPSTMHSMLHQLRNFIVGGQDTTAAMIQWTMYELSKNPHVISTMLAEHVSILGADYYPDPLSTLARISPNEAATVLQRLPYTTAILKEVLRLHAPAGTSRQVPQGTNCIVTVTNPRTGKDVDMRLDGTPIYINHHIIGLSSLVWGPTAKIFDPSRFLVPSAHLSVPTCDADGPPTPPLEKDSTAPPCVPPGAWRPFERGPRRCLGQDLAMLEGKMFLVALGAAYRGQFSSSCLDTDDYSRAKKGLRWEKVGYRGLEIDGMEEVYDVMMTTHQPVDGMRMRFEWVDVEGEDEVQGERERKEKKVEFALESNAATKA